MSNIERTRAFFAHWEARDVEAILAACAEDIFYHNIPMPPMTGREAVRGFIAPFLGNCERVVFETAHIAETSAGAVMTERVDRFFFKGGKSLSIRVMGTLEFDGAGKLAKWRDYFDLAEFTSQMG
jgi:limonene-1,2-epoxide hydrolase